MNPPVILLRNSIRENGHAPKLKLDPFLPFSSRNQQEIEANFDEYREEQEYRDRLKKQGEQVKKNPVVWDDAEERKCQQRYRKKKFSMT